MANRGARCITHASCPSQNFVQLDVRTNTRYPLRIGIAESGRQANGTEFYSDRKIHRWLVTICIGWTLRSIMMQQCKTGNDGLGLEIEDVMIDPRSLEINDEEVNRYTVTTRNRISDYGYHKESLGGKSKLN